MGSSFRLYIHHLQGSERAKMKAMRGNERTKQRKEERETEKDGEKSGARDNTTHRDPQKTTIHSTHSRDAQVEAGAGAEVAIFLKKVNTEHLI